MFHESRFVSSNEKHLLRTITTGSLLRQNELADTLATLFRSHLVGINPKTYNFSNSCALLSVRKGSLGSNALIFSAISRIFRDNLLYLKGMLKI